MQSYEGIKKSRVGAHLNLVSVLNLGVQALTGVFPRLPSEQVTKGPLELVWCSNSGLLQLKHSYDKSEMYGENYGYRSGLNQSMIQHLNHKIKSLEKLISLKSGDVVLDIGSNDATTLKAYSTNGVKRIGIDPTGKKFASYYTDGLQLIPDFFNVEAYHSITDKQANVITSIAMFYDLEDPVDFACQIEQTLADDGIWHFEQSYMPSMLRLNSYDTICHEHIEYYSLDVVKNILELANMKIIDVGMNNVNGGSFAVTAVKKNNQLFKPNRAVIDWLLEQENRMGLKTPRPFREFEERVYRHRDDLKRLIDSLNADQKKIFGYGASTKGNVVLQFCGFTSKDIPVIAEVNSDKFGCVTPGSHIPIVSEKEAHAMNPDYFLLLPWHFKESILRREHEYLARGGKFIIPFPEIEIV